MTDTLTAIIVDPFEKRVFKAEIGAGIDGIYEAIGNDCTTFDVVRLCPGVDMFIDDNGYREDGTEAFFTFEGADTVYSGRGVILWSNEEGEDAFDPVYNRGSYCVRNALDRRRRRA